MIAVMGATGFTGQRVVRQLRRHYPDEELVAVVRAESRRELLANEQVSFRTADLADVSALQKALVGARLVGSAVSLAFGHAPNLVAALVATKPDHVIFLSTMSVFRTRRNNVSDVSLEAERLINRSGLPATIFRPTMIYGRPGDRNIERLLRFLRRSPFIPVLGRGTGLQQPVHVDDLAIAVAQAFAIKGTIGRTYNVPGPRPMPLVELIRTVAAAVSRRPMFVHVPLWFADPMVRAWSITGLWPRIRAEQLLRFDENKEADPGPAVRDFSYSPREFDEGVREEAGLLGLAGPRIARDRDASGFDPNVPD
jgi:uncharacterized protein YbjT (DUF2867 family)